MPASSTPLAGVPDLEFKLSQISRSPPSVLVTLRNNSPSSTFTILKWGTPLDPQATNLGVFRLTDVKTGKKVETVIIKVSRKMPPSREDLQEIAPGTEHAIEVIFDKPWMSTEPARYQIKAEGQYHGVWEKPASQVKESELETYTDSLFDGQPFTSEETILTVE
jgi:hypothetical protein